MIYSCAGVTYPALIQPYCISFPTESLLIPPPHPSLSAGYSRRLRGNGTLEVENIRRAAVGGTCFNERKCTVGSHHE
ncbi:hypothetical protein XENTR_v10012968 [Xenopus tropicalis]|nr:hypothetical protein XENTR_v10012968 [Xenopus tropicalis]